MRSFDVMLSPFSASAALRRAVRLTDKGERRAAFPLLARAARAGGAVIETDFPAEDKFDFLPDAAGAPFSIAARC